MVSTHRHHAQCASTASAGAPCAPLLSLSREGDDADHEARSWGEVEGPPATRASHWGRVARRYFRRRVLMGASACSIARRRCCGLRREARGLPGAAHELVSCNAQRARPAAGTTWCVLLPLSQLSWEGAEAGGNVLLRGQELHELATPQAAPSLRSLRAADVCASVARPFAPSARYGTWSLVAEL
jgi:hypothetical protein